MNGRSSISGSSDASPTGRSRLDRVLVTGAAGQLGAAIVRELADCTVIPHTRASLDITDVKAVAAAVAAAAPSVVVNCAAYNDVDGAESAPVDAFAANAFAVRSLARAAEAAGAVLVHYGTDFIFDDSSREPYDEEAAPAPRSKYGTSKLLGEWFALDTPGGFVLRVESLFGSPPGWSGRVGTLEKIVAELEQGREVRVFTDRVVSPSYTVDVARATRYLLESGAAPGIYHCVNDGHASWYDVAQEAARLLYVPPRLVPITTDQVPLKAPRPRFCALATKKIAAAGFQMPTWQEALGRWVGARRGSVA